MVVAEESIAATVQADEVPASTTAKSIHRFTYRMTRHPTQVSEGPASLLGGSISVNDPVVISLEDPPVLAIARGFVLSSSLYEVVLGLDRTITHLPQLASRSDGSPVYRIDRDELAVGMGRLRDNLLQLFYADAHTRRRKLVVGLAEPRFDPRAAADAHQVMPSHLNPDQKAAVEKVLSAQDYALILGMPGTGKTTTTAEIIKALTRAGKSVLLTSYTHSAVDNILLKLVDGDGPSILRLGNHDKVGDSLDDQTRASLTHSLALADLAFLALLRAESGRLRHLVGRDRGQANDSASRRHDVSWYQRVSSVHARLAVRC